MQYYPCLIYSLISAIYIAYSPNCSTRGENIVYALEFTDLRTETRNKQPTDVNRGT
jgi:hypothetical protein